jgi:hypothetical protein
MILITGQIEGLTTRRDRTIKLSIGTNELSPDVVSDLFKMNQQFAYIGIKMEDFTPDETDIMEQLKTEYDIQKTPSQRLRSILYVNFQQLNEGYRDFNSYYVAKMDALCEHYKSKLI